MALDWPVIGLAIPLLARGLATTLQIAALAGALGLSAGFALGLCALSHLRPLRAGVAFYVDFIRGTPLLIQVFIVFFALPVLGLRLPEFWAGTLALACNAAGYVAETVRGAVGSVERGQEEAARAIGMVRPQILLWVLLPQALRPMVPPLTNELISLLKNTSLLSVISVYELTRAGQAIISTHFVPFEIYLLLALYYYVTVKALAYASRAIERRMPAL